MNVKKGREMNGKVGECQEVKGDKQGRRAGCRAEMEQEGRRRQEQGG